MTQLYLFSKDRRLKYWCMWSRPFRGEDATGINMATTERTYGPQDDFDAHSSASADMRGLSILLIKLTRTRSWECQ